jgi:hypothetical protein
MAIRRILGGGTYTSGNLTDKINDSSHGFGE